SHAIGIALEAPRQMHGQGRASERRGQEMACAGEDFERRGQELARHVAGGRNRQPDAEKRRKANDAEDESLELRQRALGGAGHGCASRSQPASHGMTRRSTSASRRVVAQPNTPTAAMPTITMAG